MDKPKYPDLSGLKPEEAKAALDRYTADLVTYDAEIAAALNTPAAHLTPEQKGQLVQGVSEFLRSR